MTAPAAAGHQQHGQRVRADLLPRQPSERITLRGRHSGSWFGRGSHRRLGFLHGLDRGAYHVTNAFGSSNTPAVTVASAAGNMVAAFMVAGNSFTATNQTLRYRLNQDTVTGAGNLQGVDAAGAASVTLNGTLAASDFWGATGVDIVSGSAAVSEYAAPWKQRPPGRLSPASLGWTPAPGVPTTAAPVALAGNQAETVTIGDATTARVTLARSLPETLTTADTTARALTQARTTTDAVTVADVVAQTSARGRAQVETVTAGDTTTRALTTPRTVAEALAAADVTARSALSLVRGAADAVTLVDAAVRALATARTAGETLALADVVTRSSSTPPAPAPAPTSPAARPTALTTADITARALALPRPSATRSRHRHRGQDHVAGPGPPQTR
jgi:hypothetical protein